jgi:hypothetical protein
MNIVIFDAFDCCLTYSIEDGDLHNYENYFYPDSYFVDASLPIS